MTHDVVQDDLEFSVLLPLPSYAGVARMRHHAWFNLILIQVPIKTTLDLETCSTRLPQFLTQ